MGVNYFRVPKNRQPEIENIVFKVHEIGQKMPRFQKTKKNPFFGPPKSDPSIGIC